MTERIYIFEKSNTIPKANVISLSILSLTIDFWTFTSQIYCDDEDDNAVIEYFGNLSKTSKSVDPLSHSQFIIYYYNLPVRLLDWFMTVSSKRLNLYQLCMSLLYWFMIYMLYNRFEELKKEVFYCFRTNTNFLRKKDDAIVFLLWFPIFMKKFKKFVAALF